MVKRIQRWHGLEDQSHPASNHTEKKRPRNFFMGSYLQFVCGQRAGQADVDHVPPQPFRFGVGGRAVRFQRRRRRRAPPHAHLPARDAHRLQHAHRLPPVADLLHVHLHLPDADLPLSGSPPKFGLA